MNVVAALYPLILEKVTVLFGKRRALDELSLHLAGSVVTAVIGNSGSGKSLALKCAAGLITPDGGEVLFEGRPIAKMGEREYQTMQSRTGFHFQDAALWANRTVMENLSLPLLVTNPGLSDGEVNHHVRDSLSSVGLGIDPSLRPASLSVGQQKMVSFLRAVITRPEILFLDDPGSLLDVGSFRQLIEKVQALKASGVSIVLATHNRAMCEQLADEVAVLADGRLVASGGYNEVMTSTEPAIEKVLRDLA